MAISLRQVIALATAAGCAAACSDSSPTQPTMHVAATASFGKNPGAGPGDQRGGGGGGGGGSGGGANNCGGDVVVFQGGARFAFGCSQFGCLYFPTNPAARALAPNGLDVNCNPIA
jgi:hypothetical protein